MLKRRVEAVGIETVGCTVLIAWGQANKPTWHTCERLNLPNTGEGFSFSCLLGRVYHLWTRPQDFKSFFSSSGTVLYVSLSTAEISIHYLIVISGSLTQGGEALLFRPALVSGKVNKLEGHVLHSPSIAIGNEMCSHTTNRSGRGEETKEAS